MTSTRSITRVAFCVVATTVGCFGSIVQARAETAGVKGSANVAPGVPLALEMVSQDLDVQVEGTFTITLALPAPLAAAWTAGELVDATMVVTAYQRILQRSNLPQVIGGQFPPAIDAVDIAVADIPKTSEGLTISVPIEAATRKAEALQLSNPGLYPVLIDIRRPGLTTGSDSPIAAQLITFVHRLPTPLGEPLRPLSIAVAMATTTDITIADAENVPDVDASKAFTDEVTRLVDAVESSAVSTTMWIPAPVIDAVSTSDPDVVQRLASALDQHRLIATPRWPLDPSAAAQANQRQLYTDWLRKGEDLISGQQVDPPMTTARTISLVDQPLSTGGAELLRDLGSRLLVLTPQMYDAAVSNPGSNTVGTGFDSSELLDVALGPDATISAMVLDRSLSRWLGSDASVSALQTLYEVADLLAFREELADSNANPSRRTVLMGALDSSGRLTIPNAERLAALTSLITETKALNPTTIERAVTSTSTAVANGDAAIITLPETLPGDVGTTLAQRIDRADALGNAAQSVASMLPVGDARIKAWQQSLELFPTSAMTTEQVEQRSARLTNELALIRQQVVVPGAFKFNLGERKAFIRIRLTNTADMPLTVRIRLSSNKMLFPDGDRIEQLPAATVTEIQVPVETRSNGKFAVALEVFTPVGDTQIAPPVFLTANVNAIGGLGKTVTGVFLLLVASWWLRHWRTTRRRAEAELTARRHPVAAGTLLDS